RDQWVTRFSQIVGKNLGPFFAAWGFNPSQAALDAVATLPVWTPIEAVSPTVAVSTTSGTGVSFDPPGGFVGLLGDPLNATCKRPLHGTLVQNADGSWLYTPSSRFVGVEKLTYTVTNAHGGVSKGTVTIRVTRPV